MSKGLIYTEQEDTWLKENATGRNWLNVTEQFNKVFDTQRSENALKNALCVSQEKQKINRGRRVL